MFGNEKMTDRRAGPGGLTEVHQKYYLYHYSHLHLTFLILKRSLMIAKTNFIFFHVGAEGLRRAGPREASSPEPTHGKNTSTFSNVILYLRQQTRQI